MLCIIKLTDWKIFPNIFCILYDSLVVGSEQLLIFFVLSANSYKDSFQFPINVASRNRQNQNLLYNYRAQNAA